VVAAGSAGVGRAVHDRRHRRPPLLLVRVRAATRIGRIGLALGCESGRSAMARERARSSSRRCTRRESRRCSTYAAFRDRGATRSSTRRRSPRTSSVQGSHTSTYRISAAVGPVSLEKTDSRAYVCRRSEATRPGCPRASGSEQSLRRASYGAPASCAPRRCRGAVTVDSSPTFSPRARSTSSISSHPARASSTDRSLTRRPGTVGSTFVGRSSHKRHRRQPPCSPATTGSRGGNPGAHGTRRPFPGTCAPGTE
jgi:hypothetical protein